MNKLLVLLLLLAPFVLLADPTTNAPAVALAWNATTNPVVTGYGIYWGIAPRTYTNMVTVPVPTTTVILTNLARARTYYFAATCKTGTVESDFSTEVSYQTLALPDPPVGLTVHSEKP